MGRIIVIDGLDGTGKTTQVNALYNKLKGIGKEVYIVKFPNYEHNSSFAVRMYLNGELGDDPDKLNPYTCALFYAIDRAIQFNQHLSDLYSKKNVVLLCDRYTSSNMIHQGSKFYSSSDKCSFFSWVVDTEYNKIGLPKEDLTVILSLPVQVSQELMTQRYNGDETKKDIHERDVSYLQGCFDTINTAVDYMRSIGFNWNKVDCSSDIGDVRDISSISEDIWRLASNILS